MKVTNKMDTCQNISKTSTLRTLASVLAMSMAVSISADAAIIVSDDFSFGFGKNTTSGPGVEVPWERQLYTSSPNTPFTQGLFTFTPTVSSSLYSGGGPLFTNRSLASTGSTGVSGFSGNSDTFGASLNFEYTGPTPSDAAFDPNYRISLVITSISIYGIKLNQPAVGTLAFSETTAGHASTSTAVTLNNVTSPGALNISISQYQHLVWNPDDFLIEGRSGVRTFALTSEMLRAVDGFEVFGRVELTYDAIPEPSTIALGVIGLTTLLFFRKRRQAA